MEGKTETISKSQAKRNYLLTDDDIQELEYTEVDNPIRKGFTAMKVYSLADVKKVAISKWGSLEEMSTEKKKREEVLIAQSSKKSSLICETLNSDGIFEEMEEFMNGVTLPLVTNQDYEISPYFVEPTTDDEPDSVQVIEGACYDDLLRYPVIVTFYDCMNREMPEGPSWFIKKKFPFLHKEVGKTPFNDRRKLGHYCWARSDDKQTLLFAMFVTTKWVKRSVKSGIPPFEYAALELAVKKVAKVLTDEVAGQPELTQKLKAGIFIPYRADEKMMVNIMQQMPFNVNLFVRIRKHQSEQTSL